MARLIRVGGATGDWFTAYLLEPAGGPGNRNDLIIADGVATIESTDPALPNTVTVTPGSTDFALPAGIQAMDATFGTVDPGDIVASALRFNAAYPGVLNSENCNWIADDLTAGAPMPWDDSSIDPSACRPGWHRACRGEPARPVG